jgi:hypothetical protein
VVADLCSGLAVRASDCRIDMAATAVLLVMSGSHHGDRWICMAATLGRQICLRWLPPDLRCGLAVVARAARRPPAV